VPFNGFRWSWWGCKHARASNFYPSEDEMMHKRCNACWKWCEILWRTRHKVQERLRSRSKLSQMYNIPFPSLCTCTCTLPYPTKRAHSSIPSQSNLLQSSLWWIVAYLISLPIRLVTLLTQTRLSTVSGCHNHLSTLSPQSERCMIEQ
jgi:hypothetical protein